LSAILEVWMILGWVSERCRWRSDDGCAVERKKAPFK
jgi:hypothetical protein